MFFLVSLMLHKMTLSLVGLQPHKWEWIQYVIHPPLCSHIHKINYKDDQFNVDFSQACMNVET